MGLAVARALALHGREVMVLEAAEATGAGTSSRNSEVIHAGIYYPQNSLKARLCVEGRQRLYAYCDERGVEYRRCGKLIVATDEAQRGQLQAIARKAEANGVHDLRWLERDGARSLEPALQCVAALSSPSTGIIDSHGLMLALQGDLEHAGGMVVCHAQVQEAAAMPEGIWLRTEDGTELTARTLVNAAGLQAPALASRIRGLPPQYVPRAYYAKGNYFTLTGRAPFSRLIYPVPEAAGLGVHLTLDMGGGRRSSALMCSGSMARTICGWIRRVQKPSMRRFDATGLRCPTPPWSLATRESGPRSAALARWLRISSSRGRRCTALPAWCNCWASSRRDSPAVSRSVRMS